MKRFFYFIVVLNFTSFSQCYGQQNNDSLLTIYSNAKDVHVKINTLHNYINTNFSNPDSSIKYSNIAIELSKEIKEDSLLAKSFNLLAVSYYYKGDLNKCQQNLNTALSLYTKIKNDKGMATCYNGIGVVYYDQGKLYKSLDLYIKSLRIKEKLGEKTSIAMTLNNIGNVYKDLNNFDKSLEYYNKSLQIKNEVGDRHGIAMTLNNIGLLHHNNQKYAKALDYYSESIAIKREIEDLHGLAMSLNNIGLTYELQKNYPKALHFHEESIAIKKQIGDQFGLAMSLINIATVYRENGNYSQCYENLLQSEKIALEIGATTQLRDCYQRLYETYEMQEKTNLAFKYYKLYITTKDSMMTEESIKNIQKLNAQYENETKQLTIESLSRKEALNKVQLEKIETEKRSKNITIISLVIGLVLSIMMVVYFIFSVKQRNKINEALSKSLDEKEVLFKEVHHRVKNNFQVISSLLNLHANNSDNTAVQKALGEAKDRVGSMALVHEKLYKSTDLTKINMREYLSQLFIHLVDRNNTGLNIDSVMKINNVFMDIETAIPLGLIFNELITNSIKYAFKKDTNNSIEIEIKRNDDKVEVTYRDNGVGLPKDFDLESLDTLGLNLVQILVLQIHGELSFKNDNGARFDFNFKLA